MTSRLISIFMTFPMRFAIRGARGYYVGKVVGELLVLLMAAVWMMAPFALWQSLGFGWVILWLVPTSGLIFIDITQPKFEGG